MMLKHTAADPSGVDRITASFAERFCAEVQSQHASDKPVDDPFAHVDDPPGAVFPSFAAALVW